MVELICKIALTISIVSAAVGYTASPFGEPSPRIMNWADWINLAAGAMFMVSSVIGLGTLVWVLLP